MASIKSIMQILWLIFSVGKFVGLLFVCVVRAVGSPGGARVLFGTQETALLVACKNFKVGCEGSRCMLQPLHGA